MFISDEYLIKFIVQSLELRNFEVIENSSSYSFRFLTIHSNPSFQIPKTKSADAFHNSFMNLPESFDFSEPELIRDADEIVRLLNKTINFVDNVYLVAKEFNASKEVGA